MLPNATTNIGSSAYPSKPHGAVLALASYTEINVGKYEPQKNPNMRKPYGVSFIHTCACKIWDICKYNMVTGGLGAYEN